MMLTLYVMRHAKSSWAVPGARDFDRELNDRGRSDLEKLGRAMSERGYSPGHVLCSAATRTRQTFDYIKEALDPEPGVTFTERLYSSGLDDYLKLVQDVSGFESVMLIGHNPMCATLAVSLAGDGDDELLESIAYKYPTGTISVLNFDVENWSQVENRSGLLVDVIIPSEL